MSIRKKNPNLNTTQKRPFQWQIKSIHRFSLTLMDLESAPKLYQASNVTQLLIKVFISQFSGIVI